MKQNYVCPCIVVCRGFCARKRKEAGKSKKVIGKMFCQKRFSIFRCRRDDQIDIFVPVSFAKTSITAAGRGCYVIAFFLCITGLSGCFFAVSGIDKNADTFVCGIVFFRQVVVVFIIRKKVFQAAMADWIADQAAIAF